MAVDDMRPRPPLSRKRGRAEGRAAQLTEGSAPRVRRGGRRARTALSLALLSAGPSRGARLSKQSMLNNEAGGPPPGRAEAGIYPGGTYGLEAHYDRVLRANEARAAAYASAAAVGVDVTGAGWEDVFGEGRSLQTVHSKTSSQSASGRLGTFDRPPQPSKAEPTSGDGPRRQEDGSDGGPADGAPGKSAPADDRGSCRPASCEDVATYGLLPVHPSCRTYVLCQHGSLTHTFDCPGGTVFDTSRNKCHEDGVCDCPDAGGSGGDSAGGSAGGAGKANYVTEIKQQSSYAGSFASSFASSGNGGGSGADKPGAGNPQTSPGMVQTQSSLELASICSSQKWFATLPLLTTYCADYVECSEGEVAREMSCPTGLAFDSTIKGCNWISQVECPPYVPPKTNSDFSLGDLGFGEDDDFDGLVVEPDDEEEPVYTVPHGKGDGKGGGGNGSYSNNNSGGVSNIATFSEEDSICDGAPDGTTPLLTTECRDYVNCVGGKVDEKLSCPEGLAFSAAFSGCQWASSVICPTAAPTTPVPTTMGPTGKGPPPPTRRPTPMPTKRPVYTKAPTTEAPVAAPVDLWEWIKSRRRRLNQEIFQSKTKDGVSYRSYWFQYQDFYRALEIVSDEDASITGKRKHVFYTGTERGAEQRDYEYGLVNIAAFLSQAMTESIQHDACDEFNVEQNTDSDNGKAHYALSNSCGQFGLNYQEFGCARPDEADMACPVDRTMVLQATTSQIYPNAPPPLECRPRSTGESFTGFWDVGMGSEQNYYPYENSFGRTDVEGCCWWGRGALHTRGICNLGKINYYLGKKASDDGRVSRYPDTDFCSFPEAICAAPESREMRWITSFFEWTERVQSYNDPKTGWNYMRKLKEFVDGGLVDFDFLGAVSGIVTKDCHDAPCDGATMGIDGGRGTGAMSDAEGRLKNFQQVLIVLDVGGENAMIRALIKYFTDRTDIMNSQVLRSQTPQGQMYPSYRYQLADFLSALTHMAEKGVGGKKFYTGDIDIPEGVRYGVVNAVMFLSQAYKESVQYDACDENNWELVNDRFPLSNACGQLGMSYQDFKCRADEKFMECPVKPGFWDYEEGRENNEDAYANALGRVDVEGCCWWGRGVIQTRGTCNYGKLNYHLGKRAALEGRDALYGEIDFCEFPQGICSSDETYGGELQWMVGFFEWADRIQTYDVDGWNYLEKLKEFTDGGYTDFSFVDAVSGVLNIGCHNPPCKGFGSVPVQPHNKRDRNDTFQRILNAMQVSRIFRPPKAPTPLPTPEPSLEPTQSLPTTELPTFFDVPTERPTKTMAPTAELDRPPPEVVVEVEQEVKKSKARFDKLLLKSEYPDGERPSYLYTWQGFQRALKKMTSGTGPGEQNFFYIGAGISPNSLQYGLVNIAAFMAHAVTQAIYYDSCDENSWEQVSFRYPISNSCGQKGRSYQDEKCDGRHEGMECEVDPTMEVYGVTRARWLGAPPPLYCADRSTGYWDHITGFEENEPPFANSAGRNDVRGCCWWGRGALQIKGVCSYGLLNHYLGKKAADEGRPSLYPDIDFCKNPGAICSDRRAEELRWVTALFHWVITVQQSQAYLSKLREFVDNNRYAEEEASFIGQMNRVLGGTAEEISRRTEMFFTALKVFGLTEEPGELVLTFCGRDKTDAESTCTPCETDMDCRGLLLCHSNVTACNVTEFVDSNAQGSGSVPLATDVDGSDIVDLTGPTPAANALPDSGVVDEGPMVSQSAAVSITTTNYCGKSWSDAASRCSFACPSGNDRQCPPEQKCFGDIETCSDEDSQSIQSSGPTSNYCGLNWNHAARCSVLCSSGTDAECPNGQKCFGDVVC